MSASYQQQLHEPVIESASHPQVQQQHSVATTGMAAEPMTGYPEGHANPNGMNAGTTHGTVAAADTAHVPATMDPKHAKSLVRRLYVYYPASH